MYEILHDLTIHSSPQKIFEAVSEPKHLNNWWTKACEGRADLGATYRLYFSPEYDWKAKVSICQSPNKFELQMTDSDADWDPTRFGFELEAKGKSTLVSFYHKAWQSTNHHYRRTSYSWAQLLRLLKNYIEKGEVVEFGHRD